MEEHRIKEVINEVLSEMDSDCRFELFINMDGSFLQDEFEAEAAARIWHKLLLLEAGASQAGEDSGLRPEEIVLAMEKCGADRRRINFRKNSFKVDLQNYTFRIPRKMDGTLDGVKLSSSFTAEDYALLAMKFDSAVPTIKSMVNELSRRIKQETMTNWIREKTADAVVEEFLKGKNFSHFNWVVNDDGTVSVNASIVEIREASITVPIEALGERLDEMNTQIEAMPRRIEEEPEEVDDVIGIPMRTNLKFQAGKLLRPCKIL